MCLHRAVLKKIKYANWWRQNTGHLVSADPAVWAESRTCTIQFPDWYMHDFGPIQLDHLTSMRSKICNKPRTWSVICTWKKKQFRMVNLVLGKRLAPPFLCLKSILLTVNFSIRNSTLVPSLRYAASYDQVAFFAKKICWRVKCMYPTYLKITAHSQSERKTSR